MPRTRTLPRRDASAAGRPEAEERRLSVLCVDDHETFLNALRRVFQADGWQVAAAGSARDAVMAALRAKYDFMVIDFKLSGRTGIELVRALLHSGVTTPALIFTAYPSAHAAGVAKGLGVDYLSKADVTVREVVKFARSRAASTPMPEEDGVGQLLRSAAHKMAFGEVARRDDHASAFTRAIVGRRISLTDFMSLAEALRNMYSTVDVTSVADRLHFLADRRAGRRRIAEAAGLESSFAQGATSAAASPIPKTGLGWKPRLIDLATHMRSAAVELASTTEQVAQISNRLGYDHHPAFDRHFRDFFGCSPTAFRRLLKK